MIRFGVDFREIPLFVSSSMKDFSSRGPLSLCKVSHRAGLPSVAPPAFLFVHGDLCRSLFSTSRACHGKVTGFL